MASNYRYPCKAFGCNKSFTTTGHLARHVKIHTGEKAHACPIPDCTSAFSRKDNMRQHYHYHLKKLNMEQDPQLGAIVKSKTKKGSRKQAKRKILSPSLQSINSISPTVTNSDFDSNFGVFNLSRPPTSPPIQQLDDAIVNTSPISVNGLPIMEPTSLPMHSGLDTLDFFTTFNEPIQNTTMNSRLTEDNYSGFPTPPMTLSNSFINQLLDPIDFSQNQFLNPTELNVYRGVSPNPTEVSFHDTFPTDYSTTCLPFDTSDLTDYSQRLFDQTSNLNESVLHPHFIQFP